MEQNRRKGGVVLQTIESLTFWRFKRYQYKLIEIDLNFVSLYLRNLANMAKICTNFTKLILIPAIYIVVELKL